MTLELIWRDKTAAVAAKLNIPIAYSTVIDVLPDFGPYHEAVRGGYMVQTKIQFVVLNGNITVVISLVSISIKFKVL